MCYVWPYNWWCKRITSILKSIHQCVKVKMFKCWSCNGGIWTVEWTIMEHLQCHKKCALDRTIHQTFLSLSCEMFLLLMKVTKKVLLHYSSFGSFISTYDPDQYLLNWSHSFFRSTVSGLKDLSLEQIYWVENLKLSFIGYVLQFPHQSVCQKILSILALRI